MRLRGVLAHMHVKLKHSACGIANVIR